jgi:hypothetical protein
MPHPRLWPLRLLPAAACLAAFGATCAFAEDSGTAFFEKKIRPLLIERCYECHSAEKGKTKGGLALDSRDAIAKGGDNGAALIPGQPDKSLIIEAVRYKNRDMQMPPKSPLPPADVKALEEWVKMGAPDPRIGVIAKKSEKGIDIAKGREHWAFSPITRPAVPATQIPGGNPIDAFVAAKLSEKGLTLAPKAEKRTLIRRATFDLTGLPPSPSEIQAFLSDDSPEAFSKVIDRLLRSPHYGERWGRHWLDVARYADSNGLDENIALGTAWRYRDYVVQSFNEDKPFARFLLEQLAGDLLPAADLETRRRHATATGFLNLGAKVLAEADKEKLVMDVVDEQIETMGRAFLGMTFGCVRCHDHKFDPVLQEDYYALAAIFKSTRSFADEKMGAISFWHETPLAGLDEFARVIAAEKALADKKKEVAAATSEATKKPSPEAEARKLRLMDEMELIEKNLPDLPTTLAVRDESTIHSSLRIHIRGSHLTLGKPVERGFPQVMQAALAPKPSFPKNESGRVELARWLASAEHPLTSRVIVNRVWTWHFNQGIVATPDNFGLLGQPPTQPELLDWLARWFSSNGWSIKDLHRLIMLSATYQQSSEPASVAKASQIDPENRLLWRFPLRRLEAEEVRDCVLAVSGQIDLRMGGKTVPLRNRQFVFNHTSKDATTYESTRRALYLPIIRNNLYDLFQQFDYPDPTVSTGLRNSTIVAPQALLLMNSEVATEAGKAFAKRLLQVAKEHARIELAHQLAYGRPATSSDLHKARDFLTTADAHLASSVSDPAAREERSWALYCQALMMANEFIYVR